MAFRQTCFTVLQQTVLKRPNFKSFMFMKRCKSTKQLSIIQKTEFRGIKNHPRETGDVSEIPVFEDEYDHRYEDTITSETAKCSKKENAGSQSKTITNLKFIDPKDETPIPVYRVLTRSGHLLEGSHHPQIDTPVLLQMYKQMVILNIMDNALNDAAIKEIIPFYLTNIGEEATQIGSASALQPSDLVYGQYREAGVLLWRGFTLTEFTNQCFNNDLDPTKGRQMPVHYGSKKLNFVSISSTLATQMPQAAGAAYVYKRSKRGNCVICYFGEGTASEGDAHAALNFASVLDCPVIFFCRNNGFAISTPVEEQYRGDGIASRGSGYGIISIRVDGNDIFAVYNAVKAARKICVQENRPVLIEAMTYRVGDHSTLVDSSGYRTMDEVAVWHRDFNPITRFRNYLNNINLWDAVQEEELRGTASLQMSEALVAAQSRKYPGIENMFSDVYDILPRNLAIQQKEMKEHVLQYIDQYPTKNHHFDDNKMP